MDFAEGGAGLGFHVPFVAAVEESLSSGDFSSGVELEAGISVHTV